MRLQSLADKFWRRVELNDAGIFEFEFLDLILQLILDGYIIGYI